MQSRKRPLRLGLTGGIGSGKSTVGTMLAELGAVLVDADRIARELTAPHGAAIEAIRVAFGPEFIDAGGALHRARMRELAFTRPEARAQLEAIVHPLVTLHSDLQARQAAEQGYPVIVFDIPLLVESGRWARRLDAVVVVDCSAETQIERVMRRSGLTPEAVQGILASQASRPQRRAVADAVIANDGDCSLEQLHGRTRQLAALFGL
jgi:dephospho-CoA kinase